MSAPTLTRFEEEVSDAEPGIAAVTTNGALSIVGPVAQWFAEKFPHYLVSLATLSWRSRTRDATGRV